MAKVKVINSQLNGNLNGSYFNDTPSNTIFSFGKFFVTTNFDNKVNVDYTNSLSSFVRPVTLESMSVSDKQSEIIQTYTTNAVLNLDKSDLNTFVRYGSAYEFLRVSIENIIVAYPGSLFANSQTLQGGNYTYVGLSYDEITNTSTFYVPISFITNGFGIVLNNGNTSIPDDNELKNMNLSYEDYVIWSELEPDSLFPVIGYTGYTVNNVSNYSGTTIPVNSFSKLEVQGNPFESLGTGTTANQDYHIRPNNVTFEEFRAELNSYEQNLVSERDSTDGFIFTIKNPTLLEDGKIVYSDTKVIWNTSDKYNIDTSTPLYQKFLTILLTIGAKYDTIKTDLISRFLTPASLKTYDYTQDGKINKLLRVYGREFDEIRQFIDSLVNINKVTYDKINNVPDQIIKNMASTFGWDYFSLVNEEELIDGFLTIDDTERDLNEDILPAEIDIELWRRILNNTSYFWKGKGTRQAIKSMFLLIGIPEPFINITEYVYTVDGKIDPNTVSFDATDFPSDSLPYDTDGYPVAPLETDDFYFQVSGDTDGGQTYLDVFRQAGFNLKRTADNKKSWVESGSTIRTHSTTPQYYQEDSKLVINTKEVDIALDTARGIEYDVYDYIKKDYAVNSSGYTLPYSYVNISLPVAGQQNTFTLPTSVNYKLGDIEVRFNGILLNAPTISGNTDLTNADYSVSGNQFTILNGNYATNDGNRRDVIQVTLVDSGSTTTSSATSGITIEYIVTRVNAKINGTYVPLPTFPRGDVQLTINGIALTKGTSQFVADYIVDPANSTGGTNQIIIQNPDVISYLSQNPEIQISYVEVVGSDDINLRSEVIRVDSFNSGKIYYNSSANKYVYKLNYKVNSASDVKFLIDGIALEPIKDYTINVQNTYEVFLPKGIRYGSVISAYYLVGGSGAFSPVVSDEFGLGDISDLSFLEFIELIQRKMVNARNRKTISNFKGGWYPTLLKIYEQYLERGLLSDTDPLQSNGYTFQNLYPFLSKYNAFFQRFVDQLLSATIIMKRGGLLIRNSVFTKQKFTYKRGVNLPKKNSTTYDMRGNVLLQYLGDDGSKFQIVQPELPPPPPPTQLYVNTLLGTVSGLELETGGRNIIGFDELSEFGVEFKESGYPYGTQLPIGLENLTDGIDFELDLVDNYWTKISLEGPLTSNSFDLTITGLDYETTYDYRAYVQSLSTGYTGTTLTISTGAVPVANPSISTKTATSATQTSIIGTGGISIVRYADIQFYGMQYRVAGASTWITQPLPQLAGPLGVNTFSRDITGLLPSTSYQYRATMAVDNVVYYGETKSRNTSAIAQALPTVTTGTDSNVSANGFTVQDNVVTDKGIPSTIVEYGIIWTTDIALAQSASFNYSNPIVEKDSTLGDVSAGVMWSKNVTGIDSETTVFYRTFARNSFGAAYGVVKQQITNQIITITIGQKQYTGNAVTPNSSYSGAICNANIVALTSIGDITPSMSFCLHYQVHATSNTTGDYDRVSHPISTNGCMVRDGSNCGGTSANQGAYVVGQLSCNEYYDDSVTINSTHPIDSYCLCAEANTSTYNFIATYVDKTCVTLKCITDAVGGEFAIGDDVTLSVDKPLAVCTPTPD